MGISSQIFVVVCLCFAASNISSQSAALWRETYISAELSDGLQAFARINEDDQEAMFYGLELNLQSSIALLPAERVMGVLLQTGVAVVPKAQWATTVGIMHGDLDYYNATRAL
eukprot:8472-Heterococcus_DN1.PRE.2